MQTNLLKPKAINVEQLGHHHAKVALEPFERGYGHTLGNAIRRVLLSSMVGYAATEVTIAGVLHEYSSIDGVQEDGANILLNLKGGGGKLDMQIKVEKGRGYMPGNLRRYADEVTKSIGRIVLDASFSPVRRVSYT